MSANVRDEILAKLKAAPKVPIPPRPPKPKLHEHSLAGEAVIEKFSRTLVEETGVVHRVKTRKKLLPNLPRSPAEEGLKKVMVSDDEVMAPLNLKAWGEKNQIQGDDPQGLSRTAIPSAMPFLTRPMPALPARILPWPSRGPWVWPFTRTRPVWFPWRPFFTLPSSPLTGFSPTTNRGSRRSSGKGKYPGQFVFITGPSMTGDIEGVLFKGMHGPRKVIVILIG